MTTEKQMTVENLIEIFEDILRKEGFDRPSCLIKNYRNGKFVKYKNDIIQTYWSGFIIGRQSILDRSNKPTKI